jgi:hypothetical protein
LSGRFERTLNSGAGSMTSVVISDTRTVVPLASRRAAARQLSMTPGGEGGAWPGEIRGKGGGNVARLEGAPARLLKAASVLVSLVGVALGFVSPSDATQD